MDIPFGMRIALFVLLVAAGVLLLWTARATATGRVGRNRLMGIRLPSTLASDEAWRAAHVRARPVTTLAGIVGLASGVFALLPVTVPVLAGGVLAGAVGMLGLALYGAFVGGRAAKDVAADSRD